ncbi:MAG TPA: acyltransferase [Polyangia bacterium]|jgi:peptidoglycan/LPS O-acetylase OafA/YrhL
MTNAAGSSNTSSGEPAKVGDHARPTTLLPARIPALDGLRGVAILLVLLHQFNVLDPRAGLTARLQTAIVEPGWIGVQLFFVLSGFLITGILLDAKGAPNFFGRFYRRRVQRIFPLYYLVLAATFFLLPRAAPAIAARTGVGHHHLWYWLYLQNWPGLGGDADLLGHTWSLAVEEQYYLIWPLAVWTLSERGLGRLCLGVAAGAFLLRVGMRAAGVAPEVVYSFTLARADALALGGLVALALRRPDWRAAVERHLPRAARWMVVTLAVVAVASHIFARKQLVTQTVGYSVLAMAGALLIAGVMLNAPAASGGQAPGIGSRLLSVLNLPPLRAIGRVSYGMYLFHQPLHLFAIRVLLAGRLNADGTTSHPLVAAAYLIVATAVLFALARLSWTLFERRFLGPSPREENWKRRLAKV